MKINISFLIVVFAISALMAPTYSMNLTPANAQTFDASDSPVAVAVDVATEKAIDGFWNIVGWYFNLASDYDEDWGQIVHDTAHSPQLVEDYVKCQMLTAKIVGNLIEAGPAISKINQQYSEISDETVAQFAKDYSGLIQSITDYSDCQNAFEEEYGDVEELMENAKEITLVHSALAVSDYTSSKTGFAELYDVAGDESGIDLNTIRRNGVVLETLVAMKTAEIMSGEEAVDVPIKAIKEAIKGILEDLVQEQVDEAREAIKDEIRKATARQILTLFGGDPTGSLISSQIARIFADAEDYPDLPPYIEAMRKTTKDFEGCLKKVTSIVSVEQCVQQLENNANTLAQPFVNLGNTIEKCNSSPENKKACDEHLVNKFGPSLNNIKDNFTLIGKCLVLEGDADKCSQFLEVDRNLYGVLQECTKPDNEVKCNAELKLYYASTGIGQILEDIEGAATCVVDTTDTCMKSDGYPPSELLTQYEAAKQRVAEARAAVDKAQETYDLLLKKLQGLTL